MLFKKLFLVTFIFFHFFSHSSFAENTASDELTEIRQAVGIFLSTEDNQTDKLTKATHQRAIRQLTRLHRLLATMDQEAYLKFKNRNMDLYYLSEIHNKVIENQTDKKTSQSLDLLFKRSAMSTVSVGAILGLISYMNGRMFFLEKFQLAALALTGATSAYFKYLSQKTKLTKSERRKASLIGQWIGGALSLQGFLSIVQATGSQLDNGRMRDGCNFFTLNALNQSGFKADEFVAYAYPPETISAEKYYYHSRFSPTPFMNSLEANESQTLKNHATELKAIENRHIAHSVVTALSTIGLLNGASIYNIAKNDLTKVDDPFASRLEKLIRSVQKIKKKYTIKIS